MIWNPSLCPVNYATLCHQTVTVYHKEGESITRRVLKNVFFDSKKTQTLGKTGNREQSTFLLLVPGDTQTVFPGDKLLPGQGKNIATREEWSALLPATVPGVVVVADVDCKYWQVRMVHLDASG